MNKLPVLKIYDIDYSFIIKNSKRIFIISIKESNDSFFILSFLI